MCNYQEDAKTIRFTQLDTDRLHIEEAFSFEFSGIGRPLEPSMCFFVIRPLNEGGCAETVTHQWSKIGAHINLLKLSRCLEDVAIFICFIL